MGTVAIQLWHLRGAVVQTSPAMSPGWAARALAALLAFAAAPGVCHAELQVAATTPIVADLVRQVGGDQVDVTCLMGLTDNPHAFDPKPKDLQRLADASMLFTSGKHLEVGFMAALQENLSPNCVVIEAGREVPSCKIDVDDEVFVCCPLHSRGAIDPHWWHSAKGMQRAARAVARALAEADPDHADAYRMRSRDYREQLDDLDAWIRSRVAEIPRARRYLTTAHAAFGYFCRDYGFKSVPVQGLTKEQNPSPVYLAETIATIRDRGIVAVFPEVQANPKVLQSMVAETGVHVGGSLLADGFADEITTYTEFMKHNVNVMVEALGP